MRDLKIKTNSKKTKFKEGYYIDASWMIGDADAYIDKTYGPFTNPEACMDFIDMLDSFVEDDYFKVEGAERCIPDNTPRCNVYWVGDIYNVPDSYFKIPEEKKKYITEKLISDIDFDIPHDPHYDRFCTQDGYEVYYLTAAGEKLKVEYEEDDNSYNDLEELEDMKQEGTTDPRTWLQEHVWTEDEFDEYEIVFQEKGDSHTWSTGCKKSYLSRYLDDDRYTVIKYRNRDYHNLLASNPWKGPDGKVLGSQED